MSFLMPFLACTLFLHSALSAAAADSIVDTMDDGDVQLMVSNGWTGTWFVSDDGTGTVFPAPSTFTMTPGGLSCPGYAALLSGTAHSGYGSLMNFYLMAPPAPVNLLAFSGVSFYAKCGSASYNVIRVEIPDMNTDPTGGICTSCFDNHGVFVALTSTWTKYSVPFSSLAQAGWGIPLLPFDASKALGVKFTVPGGVNFEIWVDEVAFTNVLAPLTQIPTPAPTCATTSSVSATQTMTQTCTYSPTVTPTATISPTFSISPTFTASPDWSSQTKLFVLKGVYPNPSSGPLNIYGVLNQPARWRITIYNVSGEQVWQDEGNTLAGNLLCTWPGINSFGAKAATGVYGIKLSIDASNGEHADSWKWAALAR